ncbi:MAG: helix-turn-helix transcriptional regulator, partial [Bacteroidales bacterium]|nr:helix-turn-helix transcriptional regulator [Bacteroidales bacterium]
NINTFIREIRLKKAAQLLRVKGYNVSEVMYEVGFNHRSYFSSCFKELFGMSPKDYAKKYQKNVITDNPLSDESAI